MIAKALNPPIGSYKAVNTDTAQGAANQDVVIAQAAEDSADRVWVLDGIQYSYKGAVIDGGIVVKVGDRTKLDLDITNGVGSFSLYIPGQTDEAIAVVLKKGGSGVIGKLNVQWHLEPAQS